MSQSQQNDPIYKGWVSHDQGYEHTKSEPIIWHALSLLQKKRAFVTLLHKGYQSGSTFLVELSKEHIVIDKPKDWPDSHTKIRVVFRDTAKLWNHFNAKVVSVTENSLIISFPQELFLLQRRAHFRINLPTGSIATFMYNHKKCKLNMEDISAGGMLLCIKDRKDVPQKGHAIQDIIISIPSEDTVAGAESGTIRFKIKKGEVVRCYVDDRARAYCLGVQFYPSNQEEERIMKFIRQRELAILRKGLQKK